MKKLYSAPSLELLAFCCDQAISNSDGPQSEWTDNPDEAAINSQPWNDGELGGGWT